MSKINYFFYYVMLLFIIGSIFIYSASSFIGIYYYGDSFFFYKKQILAVFLSNIIIYLLLHISIMKIKEYTVLYFIIIMILNILPFIGCFKYSINGAMRLIKFFGFTFQPSELLKCIYILNLSYIFDRYYDQINYVITIISCYYFLTILILMYQSDFGTIILVSSITFILLWKFLYNKKILFYGIITFLILIILLIIFKPYRLLRLITYLNPWVDPSGKGFQIIQSQIAIANGGYYGMGLGNSIQKNLFLPMAHTDFIFSIILEEVGMIGGIILVILIFRFAILFIKESDLVRSTYAKNYLFGVGTIIILQTIINVSSSTALLPTKGIGLPFVSYGMSSVIGFAFLIGIALKMIKESSLSN